MKTYNTVFKFGNYIEPDPPSLAKLMLFIYFLATMDHWCHDVNIHSVYINCQNCFAVLTNYNF